MFGALSKVAQHFGDSSHPGQPHTSDQLPTELSGSQGSLDGFQQQTTWLGLLVMS